MTLVMFLFVGATATMAQDKASVKTDATAVKTEVKDQTAKEAEAAKPSCHGSTATAEKKACAPECAKKCPAQAAATKEEHESSSSPQ